MTFIGGQMDQIQQLIAFLAREAYREGDIILSSGRHSDVYLDAKQVTYHPDCVQLVGEAVLNRIRSYDVVAVGGLTMGADAIVNSTVWASKLAGFPIPGFVVRKEPKAHGLEKWIEGIIPQPGSRVAIVDDVVTSGGSVMRAIEAAKQAELVVAVVVALVDRQEGGAEVLASHGINFQPLCTLRDVQGLAAQLETIGLGA